MGEMMKEDKSKEFDELMKVILNYRDYYGKYHNHKENVIYTTVGLYITILALIAKLESNNTYPLDIVVILIGSIMIFLFIKNQFRLREDAAKIVNSCTDLIAKSLDKNSKKELMNSQETYREKTWGNDCNKWPSALVDLLESDKRCYNNLKYQENLIYIAMFIFTIILLVYYYINK
jgi:hypothetical protein